ncbi:hypothetical protein [Streptomyces sp. WY228]|uniref:hypothetical protein n=1 Tax=Streptomyces sp. WY228 TaxID=2855836 RepID=UPI001C4F76DE|nr:hypothetical protein KV381_19590 [Streptomyces sp. WY228]
MTDLETDVPPCRWGQPVTNAMLKEPYRAHALFDAHHFLADDARNAGAVVTDRTSWRICRDDRWWSGFGKKRGKVKEAGPQVHDDLVRCDFTATCANRLCLASITEHATGEASSISARSRKPSATGSWATPSTSG